MPNRIISGILLLFVFIVFSGGCADHSPPVVDYSVIKSASSGFHKFDFDTYEPFNADGYVKKVDNFTIIFDPSGLPT